MQIFIINGLPGVGKTTFGEILEDILEENGFNFAHLSSITLVKDLLLSSENSNPEIYGDEDLYKKLRDIKSSLGICDYSHDEVFNNKSVESRRAMSNLKSAITKWNPDFLHYWVLDRALMVEERSVIFLDIREPENIEAFKEVCSRHNIVVRTVLVESDTNAEFDNNSDGSVMDYEYDIVVDNRRDGLSEVDSIAKLGEECVKFYRLRILPSGQSGLEIMTDNPEYF